jgi:hypothetical protein
MEVKINSERLAKKYFANLKRKNTLEYKKKNQEFLTRLYYVVM